MSFRYIYHAVHMTFSGGFEEAWQPGEPRESKMVFIGKGLDEQFLASSVPACGSLVVATLIASCHDQASTFNNCLATPENLTRKASTLRFKPGDAVECRTTGFDAEEGERWAAGTVVEAPRRAESAPPVSFLVAPLTPSCFRCCTARTTWPRGRLRRTACGSRTAASSPS